MRRLRAGVAVLLVVAGAGACGGDADRSASQPNSAQEARATVVSFYEEWLSQDFRSACELTAREFHLRAARIVGSNRRSGEGSTAPRFGPARSHRGSCPELLESTYRARGRSYPRSAFTVDELRMASGARRARATTTDGDSALVIEDGRWKMLWIVGPPPRA